MRDQRLEGLARVRHGAPQRDAGLRAAEPGLPTRPRDRADHPFIDFWWPPGHIVGWGDTFVHELHHLLAAIADDGSVGPDGATFEDGYRASEVADAILRSAASGSRETISYR